MTTDYGISPTREYTVKMLDAAGNEVTKDVTLPDTLANNTTTVAAWYTKYVPEGHMLASVEPKEVEEPQYVSLGDGLDYVGEDEPDEFIPEFKEDDNGESIDNEADENDEFVDISPKD